MIGFGSTEIAKAYLGGTEVSKMYLGDELVFGGEASLNPYITNGLVAMWDGEWNKDFGEHDDTITYWTDLSGNNRNLTMSANGWTWGSNHVLADGTSSTAYIASMSAFSAFQTIEVVFLVDNIADSSVYGETVVWADNFKGVMATAYSNHNQFHVEFSRLKNGGILAGTSSDVNGTIIYAGGTYTNLTGYTLKTPYLNGVAGTKSSPNNGAGGSGFMVGGSNNRILKGKLYCIRLYNRELSDDEILANYNVDAERFG